MPPVLRENRTPTTDLAKGADLSTMLFSQPQTFGSQVNWYVMLNQSHAHSEKLAH